MRDRSSRVEQIQIQIQIESLHTRLVCICICICRTAESRFMSEGAVHSQLLQIQIQIESLHTRLDEIGEMTSAASLYSRTLSRRVYDGEPRAMLAASRSP